MQAPPPLYSPPSSLPHPCCFRNLRGAPGRCGQQPEATDGQAASPGAPQIFLPCPPPGLPSGRLPRNSHPVSKSPSPGPRVWSVTALPCPRRTRMAALPAHVAHAWLPCARILPLDDADAGLPQRVLQRQAQQSPGRPGQDLGGRLLGLLLPLALVLGGGRRLHVPGGLALRLPARQPSPPCVPVPSPCRGDWLRGLAAVCRASLPPASRVGREDYSRSPGV